MEAYTDLLKEHLSQHTPEPGNFPTLCEMLYNCYTENHPVDNEQIRVCWAKINQSIQNLPYEERDRVCCAVNETCSEFERAAFLEGIHVGAHLWMELMS